jgi:hypothetical protein
LTLIGAIFIGAGLFFYPRPNAVPGAPLELDGSGYPGGKILNKTAFFPIAAPSGKQGTFGRNVLRGFGASQADIGVRRIFRVSETIRLRFRGEFFNIFNHPNFGAPVNSLTSPQFGHSTQTLANGSGLRRRQWRASNPLYQIGGPRSIQLAVKVQF